MLGAQAHACFAAPPARFHREPPDRCGRMHPTAHKHIHEHSQGSLSPHLTHTGGSHAGASLVASQGATGHACAGHVRSDRAISTRGCVNVGRAASDVAVHGEMSKPYVAHASLITP